MTSTAAKTQTERCPGGYLVRGNQLCGRAGNRCGAQCAFHYRGNATAAAKANEAANLADQSSTAA